MSETVTGAARVRPLRPIAVLTMLFSAALLPCPVRAGLIGGPITSGGYTFINFDPSPLTGAAVGSNVNGIANTGQVVGTTVDVNNASTFTNFSGIPGTVTQLNTGSGQIALAINSSGDVVGGTGASAFFLASGGTPQNLLTPAGATNAFGINDMGNIVGQFTSGAATPGFLLQNSTSSAFTTINAPSGPNAVNAQGINNNGLVVGFYLGTDGQAHGLTAHAPALPGSITAVAVADPVIPPVAGEPGATFVFSQILGINDSGLASGYYGDSTTSQHGYLYNTNTGSYTFLDDPAAGFHNGVEVTQITGITNSGEIAGFYTDAQGLAHSFVADPVPEPGSLLTAVFGLGAVGLVYFRPRRKARSL